MLDVTWLCEQYSNVWRENVSHASAYTGVYHTLMSPHTADLVYILSLLLFERDCIICMLFIGRHKLSQLMLRADCSHR